MGLVSGRDGLWRSLVSALDWGSRGPGFKSRQPDAKDQVRGLKLPLLAVGQTTLTTFLTTSQWSALWSTRHSKSLQRCDLGRWAFKPGKPLDIRSRVPLRA